MQNLNIRYPLLYTTPNCVYCQLTEDIPHLLSCSKQKSNLQQILYNLITNTTQQLNISAEITNTIHTILLHYLNTSPYLYFLNLIQGLYPISLYDDIKILLHKTTLPFFTTLSNASLNWFYQQIWLPRNILQQQWEKARNITNKSKRSKIYSLIPTSQSISNTSNTSTIDPTISIKNWLFLGYSLTNCIY